MFFFDFGAGLGRLHHGIDIFGSPRVNPKGGAFADAVHAVSLACGAVAAAEGGGAAAVACQVHFFVTCGAWLETFQTFEMFHFLGLLHVVKLGNLAGDVFPKFGNEKCVHGGVRVGLAGGWWWWLG